MEVSTHLRRAEKHAQGKLLGSEEQEIASSWKPFMSGNPVRVCLVTVTETRRSGWFGLMVSGTSVCHGKGSIIAEVSVPWAGVCREALHIWTDQQQEAVTTFCPSGHFLLPGPVPGGSLPHKLARELSNPELWDTFPTQTLTPAQCQMCRKQPACLHVSSVCLSVCPSSPPECSLPSTRRPQTQNGAKSTHMNTLWQPASVDEATQQEWGVTGCQTLLTWRSETHMSSWPTVGD